MGSELGSNYLILFFVFLILLCFFGYIFYANPYRILNFARIPMMILSMTVVLGFFIFIEYYMAHIVFRGDTSKELWINFSRYCRKYATYLGYLLFIALVAYGIFKMIQKGFYLSFNYSFWLSIGLLILVLAFINSFTKNISFDNPNIELFRNIIMYIPCLITDFIEFAKKDYADTPSTVFIVFLFLVIYMTIFYFIPLYRQHQYKNEGIVLITKSVPLNTNILSMTTDELNVKIEEKRPFYDKWFQNMVDLQSREVRSKIDIRKPKKHTDSSLNLIVPPDAVTIPYYLRQLENFTSVQNDDTNTLRDLIPFELFKKRIREYDTSLDNAYSPEEYNERMTAFIAKHPQILNILEKAQYIYSGIFASLDTVKSIPYLMSENKNINKIQKYNYHYAITSWVYLQQIDSIETQVIYSFGNRPSLYYDPLDSSLFIALNYGRANVADEFKKRKIIYKTSSILYQRWNFIVMNYRYGTLDLFINNNLVGTFPDVLTELDPHDILLVGSKKNDNIGGICNMKYYELPLNVRKINDIYKSFHNKKIPL